MTQQVCGPGRRRRPGPHGITDDRGATATEYAILLVLIAAAIVGGITLFGANLDAWFSTLSDGLP